ncbi:MAG: hypothetical protein ABSF82_02760 [Candidatus Bathyarchaeia archaeon]|jgi:hypothetical protein
MLEGKGSYWRADGRFLIYVPIIISGDSQFPLPDEKGEVKLKVEGKRLIVENV